MKNFVIEDSSYLRTYFSSMRIRKSILEINNEPANIVYNSSIVHRNNKEASNIEPKLSTSIQFLSQINGFTHDDPLNYFFCKLCEFKLNLPRTDKEKKRIRLFCRKLVLFVLISIHFPKFKFINCISKN